MRDICIGASAETDARLTPRKPVIGYRFGEKTREVMLRNGDKDIAEDKAYCCPNCNRPLEVSEFVKTKTGNPFGDKFCRRCGQAILWE